MKEKVLLLSGFEAFGDIKVNPSETLVNALDGQKIGSFTVKSVVLPVSYKKTVPALVKALQKYKPTVVVSTGVAANRKSISLERIAINWISSAKVDNDGKKLNKKIDPRGPDGLFTKLPIDVLLSSMRSQNIPTEISNSAGDFVCNFLFYKLMQISQKKKIKAGFIHIPVTLVSGDWTDASLQQAFRFLLCNFND